MTAGYVEADAADRIEFFANESALRVFSCPIFGETAAIESDNTGMSRDKRATLVGGKSLSGSSDISGFDAKFFSAEFSAIEFGGVVANGFVTTLADVG